MHRPLVCLALLTGACRMRFDPKDYDPCDTVAASAAATHRWNDQCFSAHAVPNTWVDARITCDSIGAHLVTYLSGEEADASLGLGLSSDAWIGMDYSPSGGLWNWVTGETEPYGRWAPGEPAQMTSSTAVAQRPDGSWIALEQSTPVPYTLCESRIAITSDRVYIASFEDMSWDVARAACENRGGHLATITSGDEQLLVDGIASSARMWIGGTDVGSEGTFTWITGEPYRFENWAEYEPDIIPGDDCIYTGATGWADVSCGDMHGHICELE